MMRAIRMGLDVSSSSMGASMPSMPFRVGLKLDIRFLFACGSRRCDINIED